MNATNLVDVLRERIDAGPDKTAVHWHGSRISYQDLGLRSDRLAAAMVSEGSRGGTRIAILSTNNPTQLEIWWGAMKSGAVVVPLNYRLVADEIRHILSDSGTEILFVGKTHFKMVESIVDRLPALRRIVAIDGEHAHWEPVAAWRDRREPLTAEVVRSADDIAIQIYTSGTTGLPKGVELSHRNLMADLVRTGLHGIWSDADVLLMCMPMCHMGGWVVSARCVYFGMQMLLMDGFDPVAILQAIPEHRVTKTVLVPSMVHMLLETPTCATTDLSSLEMVFYGAGAMPYELLERAMKVFLCDFATGYGMTETGGAVTYLGPADHVGPRAAQRMKSCGRADGAEVRVVDDDGHDVGPNVVGEIICRATQVMRGYFRQPEETAKAIRNGWLHTGDAGYFDPDGYLYVSDRIKDMVKSGGINVYPREIEDILLEHPAVLEVAIIGVPHPRWGESLMAIVVTRANQTTSADELIAFLQGRVAKYKLPQVVEFAATLPRNASGKILKRQLRQPYWTEQQRSV